MRYQFGEFVLDTGREELTRNGQLLHLTPKARQLLELLIERRPNVALHQDLYDALWPDVTVQDANLKNLVADLRSVLDDHEREGRFLRSVHGRGYAFRAEVTKLGNVAPDASNRLVLFLHGTHRIILRAGESILGRDDTADALIDDPEVSRHHAKVSIAPERVTVEDLGSKNGTFVRGERITSPVELFDGDEVRLGPVSLTVKVILRTDETKTST